MSCRARVRGVLPQCPGRPFSNPALLPTMNLPDVTRRQLIRDCGLGIGKVLQAVKESKIDSLEGYPTN